MAILQLWNASLFLSNKRPLKSCYRKNDSVILHCKCKNARFFRWFFCDMPKAKKRQIWRRCRSKLLFWKFIAYTLKNRHGNGLVLAWLLARYNNCGLVNECILQINHAMVNLYFPNWRYDYYVFTKAKTTQIWWRHFGKTPHWLAF